MKTINKTKLDSNENFDENNDIVSLFDINKKKINTIGENQVVDKYIIKNCPLFHPIEKDLMLDPVESEKIEPPIKKWIVFNNVMEMMMLSNVGPVLRKHVVE